MQDGSSRAPFDAPRSPAAFTSEAKPAAPNGGATRYVDNEDGRIAYDDTGGDGRLIVAIPGMGDLRSQYRRLRPLLQSAGFRVVTMDVRGHGESSAAWRDYSAHAVGRDVLALLTHLNAGRAVILGNSFAAGSALWAAHDAPQRVDGVVLLGPIVRDQTMSWFARIALRIGFAKPWRVRFWTMYWNTLFPTRKPTDQEPTRAALAKNLREPGRMDALETMIDLSKADTAAMLSGLEVPALVVMGGRDPDFPDPTAEARWLASRLHADVLIVDGAGHYPHTEMPEEVAPRLLSFLDGLRADRSR